MIALTAKKRGKQTNKRRYGPQFNWQKTKQINQAVLQFQPRSIQSGPEFMLHDFGQGVADVTSIWYLVWLLRPYAIHTHTHTQMNQFRFPSERGSRNQLRFGMVWSFFDYVRTTHLSELGDSFQIFHGMVNICIGGFCWLVYIPFLRIKES